MKKIIILLGPTGIGKTSASILLAKEISSEIISSDSMQIYRHMDIGTAKPSPEERQAIQHHMIDIVEPWESYSTGAYIEDVQPIINSIHQQGKVPIIVGGTGLYIKAMTRGIFNGPSADWELRTELLGKEENEKGFLFEYLKSLDPLTASKTAPADIRRIIRALEVCLKSDSTMSESHETLTQPLPYEFIKIGLTRDRKELYSMIEERVDAMIAQGLVSEVREVLALITDAETRIGHSPHPFTHSPIHPFFHLSSMQAIGYKEIAMHLSGEITLKEATDLVKRRSRNYAKRQFTWFRKEEGITWIDVTGIHAPDEIFQKAMQIIQAGFNYWP